MKTRSQVVGAAVVCLALGLSSCTKKSEVDAPVAGISRSEAESLNAQNSKFEASEDPAFTAQTHFAAGQLAESQGAAQAALQQYRAALKIDPHHRPSLYRLGVVSAQVRAYPEAIAAWKLYLEETQGDATVYGNLGFCHELAGQAAEAEATYRQGIAKDPKNTLCRVNYGLMLARAGRSAEAKEQLRAVLPEAQVHYNLGSVYEQQGKREEARGEYEQALKIEPKMTEAKTRMTALAKP
ncbi:MAG: tetratricopeptide repeat protein [Bacillota bacterium]